MNVCQEAHSFQESVSVYEVIRSHCLVMVHVYLSCLCEWLRTVSCQTDRSNRACAPQKSVKV